MGVKIAGSVVEGTKVWCSGVVRVVKCNMMSFR